MWKNELIRSLCGILLILLPVLLNAQSADTLSWRASLLRNDGKTIDFILESFAQSGRTMYHIVNGKERLLINEIQRSGDSTFITLPFFNSVLRFKTTADTLSGIWVRNLTTHLSSMPFRAIPEKRRFDANHPPAHNISGSWATRFYKKDNRIVPAVGEFVQQNEMLTGTFILPSGDYRFLEGVVSGDTLRLSTFDGNHAFLFEAIISNDSTIDEGRFYSGNAMVEQWTARLDPEARPDNRSVTHMREGESTLDFRFRSTDGKFISINDPVYKGKVVLVQLMGSWCPNCMDETRFLSEYYSNNKQFEFEVIALAYERTTDFDASVKSLSRFQERFNIQYPILVTEVSVNDSLKTEKTLPQLSEIKHFPTLIYIDKKGYVRKIQTGFRGPGSGIHHERFVQEFEQTLHQLLEEKL